MEIIGKSGHSTHPAIDSSILYDANGFQKQKLNALSVRAASHGCCFKALKVWFDFATHFVSLRRVILNCWWHVQSLIGIKNIATDVSVFILTNSSFQWEIRSFYEVFTERVTEWVLKKVI